MKRIAWLDVAKAICIISVILGHQGHDLTNSIVYTYHLTVFFIVSGYTLKPLFSKDLVSKKFRSVMPPYFVTCFFIMLGEIANTVILKKQTSAAILSDVVKNGVIRSFFASGAFKKFGSIDLSDRAGAIWFLPALFFATIITPLIIKYIKNKPLQYCVAFALSIAAYISARYIWFPFSVQAGLFAVPYVLFGYDLKNYSFFEKLAEKPRDKVAVASVCLIICALCYPKGLAKMSFVTAFAPDILLSFAGTCAAGILVIFLSMLLSKVKPLEYIGRNSLYVLCVHIFEMMIIDPHISKAVKHYNLPYGFFVKSLLDFIPVAIITALFILLKNHIQKHKITTAIDETATRDYAVDIAKAFAVVLIPVLQCNVSQGAAAIIGSICIPAIVFFSGCLFKPTATENMRTAIRKSVISFVVPYFLYATVWVLINPNTMLQEAKTVLFCMSNTKNVLTGMGAVGAVWLIPMLFLVKIMYLVLCRFVKSDIYKTVIAVALSLLGALLGQYGIWLPWSLDCAFYVIIFYHIGSLFGKYRLLYRLYNNPYCYFILSTFWIYSAYIGGMELQTRNYGEYSIAIIGVVSAVILLYLACRFFASISPRFITTALKIIGRSLPYILIINCLTGVNSSLSPGFMSGNSALLFAGKLLLQILFGCLLGESLNLMKKLFKPKKEALYCAD